ncbi:MAG: S9 family peptidase, partial [Planctomycetota bacterium]
ADPYPKNFIGAVSLSTGAVTALAEGADFYSDPRISPDGKRLCWLQWDHPNMPWDGTQLWVGEIRSDGTIGEARKVGGGLGNGCTGGQSSFAPCFAKATQGEKASEDEAATSGTVTEGESIFQPEWSPGGVLHFVSDRTGWWNLYRLDDSDARPLCPTEAEFGMPRWVFGMSTYGFVSDDVILCAYTRDGVWRLSRLDTGAGALADFDLPYTQISGVRVEGGRALITAGGPRDVTSVVLLDLEMDKPAVLRKSSGVEIDSGYVSQAESIEFPTEGGLTAYALFYPPKNRDFAGPEGELPPLLVHIHGGPTSAARTALSLSTQYWTSRGFAVVDVNYGGSTGYGREYRERLEGRWGVVDVDDCCNAARYLVDAGRVDGERLAIAGGSAGGYTTLCALAFRDAFKAGASHFGVSDAEALAVETHKFESRYLDRLIGPYPEERELYVERSPIHFTERLTCPVIFFQGLEDKIVPPDQAEKMFDALRERGIPTAYVAFEGEQHGFRQAEHIKRALDGEFHFYSRIFGFEPADATEPVEIVNLT